VQISIKEWDLAGGEGQKRKCGGLCPVTLQPDATHPGETQITCCRGKMGPHRLILSERVMKMLRRSISEKKRFESTCDTLLLNAEKAQAWKQGV